MMIELQTTYLSMPPEKQDFGGVLATFPNSHQSQEEGFQIPRTNSKPDAARSSSTVEKGIHGC